MGLGKSVDKFNELYADEVALTNEEVFEDLLSTAEMCGSSVFAKIVCIRLFGHSEPRRITREQMDLFIEIVDPIIMAAIRNTELKQ